MTIVNVTRKLCYSAGFEPVYMYTVVWEKFLVAYLQLPHVKR